MDLKTMDVFALAEQRLDWVSRRQELLAQNVANANTPGYQARDLKPFAALLTNRPVALAETNPMHLVATHSAFEQDRGTVAERAPDGNAISLDEELTKLADTGGMHQLATNLYTKYMGMFRTALGKNG
jgi:flagellar basal-body rod protein FlgB